MFVYKKNDRKTDQMTTILVKAGEHSQTLFLDTAKVDELADGSAAALALKGAPHGNTMAAALDLLSAYAASQPEQDTSATQELVAAVCLWVLRKGMPAGQFDQAKTALKMPGFALCLTINGSGSDAAMALEIVTPPHAGVRH
jgi:hypothetical protein